MSKRTLEGRSVKVVTQDGPRSIGDPQSVFVHHTFKPHLDPLGNAIGTSVILCVHDGNGNENVRTEFGFKEELFGEEAKPVTVFKGQVMTYEGWVPDEVDNNGSSKIAFTTDYTFDQIMGQSSAGPNGERHVDLCTTITQEELKPPSSLEELMMELVSSP